MAIQRFPQPGAINRQPKPSRSFRKGFQRRHPRWFAASRWRAQAGWSCRANSSRSVPFLLNRRSMRTIGAQQVERSEDSVPTEVHERLAGGDDNAGASSGGFAGIPGQLAIDENFFDADRKVLRLGERGAIDHRGGIKENQVRVGAFF